MIENHFMLTTEGLYRSYNKQNRFEPTVYRLWNEGLGRYFNESFTRKLGVHALEKARDEETIVMLAEYFRPSDYMRMLETRLFHFALTDEYSSKERNDREEDRIRLLASMKALIAGVHRMHRSQKIVLPKVGRSFSYNTLLMLHGEAPDTLEEHALDALLCAYIPVHVHRDDDSSRSIDSQHLISSAVSHWRKLENDRRFGRILRKMVSEVEGELTRSLPSNIGFTNVHDHRCGALEHFAFELGKQRNDITLYKAAKKLELHYEKQGLYPCLDYYAALLMYNLRIPTELFAPVVCLSKISGWLGSQAKNEEYLV